MDTSSGHPFRVFPTGDKAESIMEGSGGNMLSRLGRLLNVLVTINPLKNLYQSKSGAGVPDLPADGNVGIGDQFESISRSILNMETHLEGLNRTLDSNREKSRTIEELHEELQRSRQGLLEQAMRPVLLDIIGLHDRIDDRKRLLELEGGTGDTGPLKMLTEIGKEVQDILKVEGVALFREEGNLFDPARQRALATLPAPDETQIGQVTERFYPGFEIESTARVVRMEHVRVYRSTGF